MAEETTTPQEAGGARAWLSDGTSLRVAAASHEAIGVELSAWQRLHRGRRVELSLGDEHHLVGPVEAEVALVEPRDGGGALAVLAFRSLSAERRRQLAALLLRWPQETRRRLPPLRGLGARLLTDSRRVERILSMLASEELPGLVRRAGAGAYTDTRVRAVGFDPSSDLPLTWLADGELPEPPFTIDVALYEFLYVIPVLRARAENGGWATDLPQELLRLPASVTWLRAIPAGSRWEIRLASGGGRTIERASADRVAFVLRPGERPTPGQRFAVELAEEELPGVRGTARVLELWPSPVGAETLCTVEFEPRAASEEARWARSLERLLHPHTRRAGTWATSLWELYDKSGYFRLSGKTTAHFSRLRQPFAIATRRLDTAAEIGCQVVWPSPDRVEAALSVLVIYAGTAMVYQVARRRDESSPVSGRQMLREINLHAFEQLQRDGAFEWTLVYVQEGGARWSQLAYQSFSEAQLPTGLACVLRFRAMEAVPAARAPAEETDIRVRAATDGEIALLVTTLPSLRSAPYLETLDLVPERFDLAQVRRRWAGAGFTRERAVLVAHGRQGPLAAAVLESAQDALHLFGLLDCVRFYPLVKGGEAAHGALVEAARSWFRVRGKETFVCFFEEGDADATQRPGLRDLGAAHLMTFPRLLLPEFLEHLHLITAPHSGAARRRLH